MITATAPFSHSTSMTEAPAPFIPAATEHLPARRSTKSEIEAQVAISRLASHAGVVRGQAVVRCRGTSLPSVITIREAGGPPRAAEGAIEASHSSLHIIGGL